MPSPFPGMDPFFERPLLWLSAQRLLIGGMTRALNHGLPANYFVRPNERVYVVHDDRAIDHVRIGVHNAMNPRAEHGGELSAVADRPLVLILTPHVIVETFVNVVHADAEDHVVATIEILSPHNKTKSHEGRRQYLAKQKELLSSRTHLLEIDLLRKGPHTVAAPAYWLNQQDPWHYVVSLHRGGAGSGRFEAWTSNIRNRLPRFYVPLEGNDEPVTVDLQALLVEC